MFGYEFVNLSPEQVEARRRHLDQAGFQAYLLPVFLLFGVYSFRSLLNLVSSNSNKTTIKRSRGLQLSFHRLRWLLNDTYLPEFGPLHVQVIGSIYIAALLYYVVRGTGKDYMHVTKAFGHVAVSQFPLHYLLSIKHPKSPITIATGLTHERLNAYHRLLGRIIHALLATHAALYINFFIAINVLSKRLNDWDVRYGLMAFWSLNILGLLALPIVRQKAYHKLFYRSHVLLSILLTIVVWLHVPYTRNYVTQAAFFWVSNGVLRKGNMAEKAQISCEKVGDDLIEVTAVLKNGMSWEAWLPGMHGYLNQSGMGPRTPFTVTDARERNQQAEISFVVRDLGGPMTGLLGRSATEAKTLTLEVEGPYGEAQVYFPDALQRSDEPTVVVAGGVGATYALPIYLALAERRKNLATLKLIWIVKRLDDAKWGLEMLKGKAKLNVQIYVTQGKGDGEVTSRTAPSGIEISATSGRPNLTAAVDSFLGPPEKDDKSISIMVCGPGGLSASVREAVTKYAWHGRTVRWYEEQFGFGGS